MLPAPETLLAILLGGVRVLALCITGPVVANPAVPVRIRVGLAFTIGLALLPVIPRGAVPPDPSPLWLVSAAVCEVGVGAVLGFGTRLAFDAIGLLGGFVSIQGGLGAATVVDPTSGASSAALSSLFQAIAVIIYLAVDGHHALFSGVAASFTLVPPGGDGPDPRSFLALAQLGSGFFEIAVRLAAPVTVAMFLANVATGVIGRAMPQMNLMVVQLPAHILMVLALMLAGAAPFVTNIADMLVAWNLQPLALLAGER